MSPDSANMQQAISKAVRSSLESLQRQSEELHQAIGDLVAACSSSRPTNALPATLRAQSAAAALAASLDVLSRFIAASPQPSRNESEPEENLRVVAAPVQEAPPAPVRPAPSIPTPMSASPTPAMPSEAIAPPPVHIEQPAPAISESNSQEELATEAPPYIEEAALDAPHPESADDASFATEPPAAPHSEPGAADSAVLFDLNSLPPEQQEMHRRANRVAKVSMQDIQLLKPDQVVLGREHHDLCNRLNEEIGKARKEYERRFGPILGHGVDYFYHWMVEVLAAGDPEALGEYPYSSPALQRK